VTAPAGEDRRAWQARDVARDAATGQFILVPRK